MTFYSEIAPFYDDIFPVTDMQLKFLEQQIGEGKKCIIDIACGNGGHAVALAKKGHIVTAIDSDQEMLKGAVEKAALEGVEIATVSCKMDEMSQHITGKFDCAICIGNSLVHLDTKERVRDFLSQMKSVLKDDGIGIIQIINYNKVIHHGMTTLPIIENQAKSLNFKRDYHLKDNQILFHTVLQIGDTKYENTIPLIPLLKEEMEKCLQEVGFMMDKTYGSYEGASYSEDKSMHYICVVRKGPEK